jgi:hypothetical protein
MADVPVVVILFGRPCFDSVWAAMLCRPCSLHYFKVGFCWVSHLLQSHLLCLAAVEEPFSSALVLALYPEPTI